MKVSQAQENTNPKVAYIIVAWNNKDLLDECINSIKAQTYQNHRIILVDNASSDGTIAHFKNHFPDIEILAQPDNFGFAKGNNIGIRRAIEDIDVSQVILLNSDARLAPDWTETLLAFSANKPKIAMLQSVTLDYYDHGIIDSTHLYISQLGQATQGSFREPIVFDTEVAPYKVFGCNAAAVMVSRAFINEQPFDDFFDETMFMYLEDVDVGARATVMGWDSYVVPGTRAYHMGSASSGKNPKFSLYMTFRNNLGLLIKNLPGPILFKILMRIPKSDMASIKHLRRIGKPEGITAIIKGRMMSLFYVPIFLVKRQKLKRSKAVDADYLWLLMRRGY